MKFKLILALIVFAGAAGHYTFSVMQEISGAEATADIALAFEQVKTTDVLPPNKFIDDLPIPSIRVDAETCRNKYLHNSRACELLRTRMKQMTDNGGLDTETVRMINRKIRELEDQNRDTKKQYEQIRSYAELDYVKRHH